MAPDSSSGHRWILTHLATFLVMVLLFLYDLFIFLFMLVLPIWAPFIWGIVLLGFAYLCSLPRPQVESVMIATLCSSREEQLDVPPHSWSEGAVSFPSQEESGVVSPIGKYLDTRSTSIVKVTLPTKPCYSTSHEYRGTGPSLPLMVHIGAGSQGSVFEDNRGKPIATKKETTANSSSPHNLAKEFEIHFAVANAFGSWRDIQSKYLCKVRVPHVFAYMPPGDDENLALQQQLPPEYRTRGGIMRMELVFPLPDVVRRELVDWLWRPHAEGYPPRIVSGDGIDAPVDIEAILDDTANKHFLVRPLLGSHWGPTLASRNPHLSLRDFHWHLEAIQEMAFENRMLGLDLSLAEDMGRAFAVMQWQAEVDGEGVEFLIGSSCTAPEDDDKGPERVGPDPCIQYRKIGMYLLDFGRCEKVDLNGAKEVVYKTFRDAIKTAQDSLSVPSLQQRDTYRSFHDGYRDAGRSILRDRGLEAKFSMDEMMPHSVLHS